ncbi:MAG: Hsp70 family protein [Marinibacterium sp.]
MPAPATLGIDFGTSNSAAGIVRDGAPLLIPLEPGAATLPTAVFFEGGARGMKIGKAATSALIDGAEGRYMRSLKSVLGTPLMHEERRIGGRRRTLMDIIAAFLGEVKARAETATGQTFTHALSGRPVRFHSRDGDRNDRAEDDLRACYLAAGFEDVRFLVEPEAALRATPPAPGLGLIVDIGGGTSDFTAFDCAPDGTVRILASHGVRLGGTDFDRWISLGHVMPELGRGSLTRAPLGGEALPAPNRLFADLATWAMIPFLYTSETRRLAGDLARDALDPVRIGRLRTVLDEELGHDIAFAVEAGKIAANAADHARIDLSMVEPGLDVALSNTAMKETLADTLDGIGAAAAETLDKAGIDPARIDRLVMVGGSSLMAAVRNRLQILCPAGRIEAGRALTIVADGLALASSTAFDGD